MATNSTVFAHCTLDSIIRCILIREAHSYTIQKKSIRNKREKEEKKSDGGYLNGVDF